MKFGAINGLTKIGIMPHWYTAAQWRNQFPDDTTFDMHITLKLIKADLTPHDNIQYCLTWVAPQKKGCPKKDTCRKSITDHIKQSAKKKCRTKKTTKTPEDETVDLEGKSIKDGQEGKA